MKNILNRTLLLILLIAGLAYGNSNLPKGYFIYRDDLYKEVNRLMPDFLIPSYFGSLIEHESCISLTHSRCWNPASELKTKREQGIGFGQITRAWNENGSLRFDVLSDLLKKYPNELKGLNWDNMKTKPDSQIRAMLLLWRSNYNLFKNKGIDLWNMIAFSDSAYNGGYGHVTKDMQLCKMKPNCNQFEWFGNVEKYSVKSTKALYGNRSAYDINRHHVKDVLYTRLPKYINDWVYSGMYMKYPIMTD